MEGEPRLGLHSQAKPLLLYVGWGLWQHTQGVQPAVVVVFKAGLLLCMQLGTSYESQHLYFSDTPSGGPAWPPSL